ncbi:MAG TPA: amino acid adenylation domain-containing protein [Allosphingosinicella sp.]|jgi:amino acid adenylation domain-containing protein
MSERLNGPGGPRQTLHGYFDSSAERYPDRPALFIGGRFWTYRRLAAIRDRIRRRLEEEGLGGARRPVAIVAAKGPVAYAGLLAAMASGNIFFPLNPALPPARLRRLIELASPAAIIVANDGADVAAGVAADDDIPVLAFDADRLSAPGAPGATVGPEPPPGLAYLLFTSGSTGTPKGVPVSHANACACIEGVTSLFPLTPEDRATQFAELSFDFAIAEMFLCWRAGGCLFVPSRAEQLAPAAFVRRNELTVWSSVPTLASNLHALRLLTPGAFPSLRLSFFCGEALPSALAARWREAAPNALTVNFYGPTEASVFATAHVCGPSDDIAGDVVPIGFPLPGFACAIQRPGEAQPAAGELLLAGPQVVEGYWRDPAATARAFGRYQGQDGIWYRTGDLVSFDPETGYRYLGRVDHQVQLRGYRVELEEIEAVIREATSAETVAAVAVVHDRLAEAVWAYHNRASVPEEEAKEACRRRLPAYMVPERIIGMEALPCSLNGKIDRVVLAERARAEHAARGAWSGGPRG